MWKEGEKEVDGRKKNLGKKASLQYFIGTVPVSRSLLTFSGSGSVWHAFYELSYLNYLQNCEVVNIVMRKQILKEGLQVCTRGNKLWKRYLHLVILLGRAICGGLARGLGRGRKPAVNNLNQDLRWSRRKLWNWEVFQNFTNQGKRETPASINHCRQTPPDRNNNLGWSSSSSLQPRAISERDSKLPGTNILINWKNWYYSPEGTPQNPL